ncbi:MAG: HD domain-containing protein [Anaerolineaceae bacterium]|nr:HD domain-containing protein [Anaerolineaceae bacterium]
MAKQKPVRLNTVIVRLLIWQLIAPTALIGFILLIINGYQAYSAVQQNQQQTVISIAARLDDYLKNSRQSLAGLVSLAQLQPDALPLFMQAVQQSNPIFSTIYYLNSEGKVIDLTPFDPSFVGIDMSAQPFLAVLNQPNSSYLSKPVVSLISGKLVVTLATELPNNHLLVAEIDLQRIQTLVLGTDAGAGFPVGEIFITDEKGNLLAHPHEAFVQQQLNRFDLVEPVAFFNIFGLVRGERGLSLTTSSWAKEAPWLVTTQLPLQLAFGPYLITGTVLFALLLSLWILVVTRIRDRLIAETATPLSHLSRSVKLLSSGDFSSPTYPLKIPEKIEEIRDLSEDFQQMSRTIQERQTALLKSEKQEHEQRILAEALRDTAGALTSTLDFSEVLERILSNVGLVVPHDSSSIILIDDDGETAHVLANKGMQPGIQSKLPFQNPGLTISQTATLQMMLKTGETLVIPDTLLEPSWPKSGESAWVQSYAGAPIEVQNKIIGFINLYSKTPGFYHRAISERLKAFADQAGVALNNARLLQELQEAYDKTLQGWSKALELRDYETEGHTIRVVEMTERLAIRLGVKEPELTYLRYGSLLHDIGKIGIPDSILLKKGPLSSEEWQIMRQHPKHAYEILSPIPYLRQAIDIPYAHHEKWDGSGYPRGLKGEQIPFAARIFAIMDVWDGLVSRRPYHEPWPEEQALSYILDNSGVHFDPGVVSAFLKLYEDELKYLSTYYRS